MGRRNRPEIAVIAVLLLSFPRWAFGGDAETTARAVLEAARARRSGDAVAVARALEPASPRTIAELRLLLGDPDAFLRGAAVQTLSLLGDHPVQRLARMLDEEDKGVRLAAEEALVAAGAAAVDPLGEVLLTASCLSESIKAAARILGRIGDPAGVPYLANVLIKYRKGGFPHRLGMEALRAIGGPPAVAQLLQMTDIKELGEDACLALMAMDRAVLLQSVEALLGDASADLQLRFAYALQLNEIAGTTAALPVLLKFFGDVAADPGVAIEVGRKGASLRNLFAGIQQDAQYYRAPLTQQRLNAMFAVRKEDEESPFIEARREQERKMDAIRQERKRVENPRPHGVIIIGPSIGGRIHTYP